MRTVEKTVHWERLVKFRSCPGVTCSLRWSKKCLSPGSSSSHKKQTVFVSKSKEKTPQNPPCLALGMENCFHGYRKAQLKNLSVCFCCVLVTAKICGNKGDLSNCDKEGSSCSFQWLEAAFVDDEVLISEGTILNSCRAFTRELCCYASSTNARSTV